MVVFREIAKSMSNCNGLIFPNLTRVTKNGMCYGVKSASCRVDFLSNRRKYFSESLTMCFLPCGKIFLSRRKIKKSSLEKRNTSLKKKGKVPFEDKSHQRTFADK